MLVSLTLWILAIASRASDPIPDSPIPLAFEQNRGQSNHQAPFLARGPGYMAFLASDRIELRLEKTDRLVLDFLESRRDCPLRGVDPMSGSAHYLRGATSEWKRNVPLYRSLLAKDIYPGIDLVYRSAGQRLEYDFIVSPGANPGNIRFAFRGSQNITIEEGALLIHRSEGVVRHAPPIAYQVAEDGEPTTITADYCLQDETISFTLETWDPSRELVIDPVVAYSTFLGGGAPDSAAGVATASDGSVFVAGTTSSVDFPLRNPFQGDQPDEDFFVTRISKDGTDILYSTYIGGNGEELCRDVTLDSEDRLVLVGETTSSDLPVTANAFDRTLSVKDAAVIHLNAQGDALHYATYLGGSFVDEGKGIAVDSSFRLYVSGSTASDDFPTTPGVFQETPNEGRDGFVTVFGTEGGLVYSTYLGGGGLDAASDIDVDLQGKVAVCGGTQSEDFPLAGDAIQGDLAGATDGFVTVVKEDGSALEFSTYVGGTGNDNRRGEGRILFAEGGDIYFTGRSASDDFPTTEGAFQENTAGGSDAFITRLNPSPTKGSSALVFSTFLGGSASDSIFGSILDSQGRLWVTGKTGSLDFPLQNPMQPEGDPLSFDGFLTAIDPDGRSLFFSSYFGDTGDEVPAGLALREDQQLFLAGTTNGRLPGTDGLPSGQADAFLARIDLSCDPSSNYGEATPGSGGFVPRIFTSGGPPRRGNISFAIEGRDMLAAASGFLLIGFGRDDLLFREVHLLIDVSLPFFVFPVVTDGPEGTPGAGGVQFALPLPDDPDAIGIEIVAQYLLSDPGGPAGFAATDGVSLVVCDSL